MENNEKREFSILRGIGWLAGRVTKKAQNTPSAVGAKLMDMGKRLEEGWTGGRSDEEEEETPPSKETIRPSVIVIEQRES